MNGELQVSETNYKTPGSVSPGSNMSRRDAFVRVRLVPAHIGHATQVKFTEEERTALIAAADKVRLDPSTFLRELGVAAGQEHHAKAAATVTGDLFKREVIERAAELAHMNPGEWMRVVALSAIGYSKLDAQLHYAQAAFEAGMPRDED